MFEAFPQILLVIQILGIVIALLCLFVIGVYAYVYVKSRQYKSEEADEQRKELRDHIQGTLIIFLACILMVVLLPFTGTLVRLFFTGSA